MPLLCLVPLEEIEALQMEASRRDPSESFFQKEMAFAVTRHVHGVEAADKARRASQLLFDEGSELIGNEDTLQLLQSATVPFHELAQPLPETVLDACVTLSLCKSKGECRRLVSSGGLYVNHQRIEDPRTPLQPLLLCPGRAEEGSTSFALVRFGKKQYHVVVARNRGERQSLGVHVPSKQ